MPLGYIYIWARNYTSSLKSTRCNIVWLPCFSISRTTKVAVKASICPSIVCIIITSKVSKSRVACHCTACHCKSLSFTKSLPNDCSKIYYPVIAVIMGNWIKVECIGYQWCRITTCDSFIKIITCLIIPVCDVVASINSYFTICFYPILQTVRYTWCIKFCSQCKVCPICKGDCFTPYVSIGQKKLRRIICKTVTITVYKNVVSCWI